MPPDQCKPIINGKLGQIREIMQLINTAGMTLFIAVIAVALAVAWVTGFMPTPWVTPSEFKVSQDALIEMNKQNMNWHKEQMAASREQTAQAREQTRVLRGIVCEMKTSIFSKSTCYKESIP